MKNRTIMQFFEWYLPSDCTLWYKLKKEAEYLKTNGITDIWLPPAYKACGGISDVGYGVYDLYDLGEFNQRGTVPTKYGTKDQYLEAIDELHINNINVLADVVFNQRMGADETEEVIATEEQRDNRNVDINKDIKIKHGQSLIFKEEIMNIQILSGIGHIFMVLTGMKIQKNLEYTDFMENIGMNVSMMRRVTSIILWVQMLI